MGPIGVQEMIAILIIALVLFGPKKLPELGRMLGKGLSEFRRAKSELKATFESHLNELERETRETTLPSVTVPKASLPTTDYSSPRYTYPYEDQGTWETGNSQETVPSAGYTLAPPIEPTSAAQAELFPNGSTAAAVPVPGTVHRGGITVSEEHPA